MAAPAITLDRLKELIGGHVTLDSLVPKDVMFQCFLTNNHGHFAQSRVVSWQNSGLHFASGIKRIVHASYVTFPWSSTQETHDKSVADIHFASHCANVLGIWGLNVHLPKEYHLSTDFERHVSECFQACSPPCVLLFEITGSSTSYVSQGQLPALPIHRMKLCQKVIEKVAKAVHRENDWGFCFDTAHAFVQGQPLTTVDDVERFIADAEGVRISAVHLNGSRHPFRSGRDQHCQTAVALDFIWGNDSSGLAVLMKWIVQNRIPTILERPGNSTVNHYESELRSLHALIS